MSTPSVSGTGQVRTERRPSCPVCGAPSARVRYANLIDRLFSAGGEWKLVECSDPACGTLWLDPAPVAEDLPALYSEYLTHQAEPPRRRSRLNQLFGRAEAAYLAEKYGYGEVRGTPMARLQAALMYPRPRRRETLDSDVCYVSACPGGRLLEIGCGSGAMLQRMQERGWQVEGVDFDPQAVAQASSLGLRVRAGDILKMSLPASTYDVVVMRHVIEHVPDARALLRECWRLLRPGGRLVVVTPNNRALSHRLFGRHWMPLDPPRHLSLYSRSTLKQLAEAVGFDAEILRTTAREAGGVFNASASIMLTGRYVFGRRSPLLLRLCGMFWQLLESAVLMFAPGLGAEIVFIARKPIK